MKVTLQNLTKKFPSRDKKAGKEVIAVNDFTLDIPDGKLIGLLGPSGCGKSTTLNLLSGLQKPTSGKIFFGEDDVTDLPAENRGIGLVFQNYALYPHLTVKQNILFPLENLKGKDKLTKEQMLEKAYEVARLVQIDMLMDRKPNELSGGQQQRVAIARAIVTNPKLILADEPTGALDSKTSREIIDIFHDLHRQGNTIVLITHDNSIAVKANRIIRLADGKIVYDGDAKDPRAVVIPKEDGYGV